MLTVSIISRVGIVLVGIIGDVSVSNWRSRRDNSGDYVFCLPIVYDHTNGVLVHWHVDGIQSTSPGFYSNCSLAELCFMNFMFWPIFALQPFRVFFLKHFRRRLKELDEPR